MSDLQQWKPEKSVVGVFRFSVVGFLVVLLLVFVTAPIFQQLENGRTLESSLVTMVLVLAVLAVGHRRRVFVMAAVLLVPVVSFKWLNHFWADKFSMQFYLFSVFVFVAFLIFQFIRFILRAPRVDIEVVCAGISVYLLLGMIWSFAYMLVALMVPESFFFDGRVEAPQEMTSFTSVYFSFITLTTVGYGDITPVKPFARMLASAEAMTGTLFVAIFISRLVSLYSRQPTEKAES